MEKLIVKFDKIREDKRGVSNSLGILIKKIKNYNYIQSKTLQRRKQNEKTGNKKRKFVLS